jgi:hypothetical protein
MVPNAMSDLPTRHLTSDPDPLGPNRHRRLEEHRMDY